MNRSPAKEPTLPPAEPEAPRTTTIAVGIATGGVAGVCWWLLFNVGFSQVERLGPVMGYSIFGFLLLMALLWSAVACQMLWGDAKPSEPHPLPPYLLGGFFLTTSLLTVVGSTEYLLALALLLPGIAMIQHGRNRQRRRAALRRQVQPDANA